jgi:nucleoside-diphosphate-sugar epimerase
VTSEQRVLVTGASGFIGRWSVQPLLRAGFEVHSVTSQEADRLVLAELSGSAVHAADLLNETSIDALLDRVRPTHLLHFAWIATPGVYLNSADNFRWLAASRYLLRCFRDRGGRRAVLAGSCAEYDWSQASLCDEMTTPLAVESAATTAPYAACKIALQKSLAEFGRREGISTAWGRIFFQFGPHEHPDRLVPSVIRRLLRGEEATCSHGQQIRSFLHAADVGAAFAKVLISGVEGPINIGSDEQISIGELIELIGCLVRRSDLIRVGTAPSGANQPAVLLPMTERLRREANWQPRFNLSDGLQDAIRWWRRSAE